jgi:hypothetical protein
MERLVVAECCLIVDGPREDIRAKRNAGVDRNVDVS